MTSSACIYRNDKDLANVAEIFSPRSLPKRKSRLRFLDGKQDAKIAPKPAQSLGIYNLGQFQLKRNEKKLGEEVSMLL